MIKAWYAKPHIRIGLSAIKYLLSAKINIKKYVNLFTFGVCWVWFDCRLVEIAECFRIFNASSHRWPCQFVSNWLMGIWWVVYLHFYNHTFLKFFDIYVKKNLESSKNTFLAALSIVTLKVRICNCTSCKPNYQIHSVNYSWYGMKNNQFFYNWSLMSLEGFIIRNKFPIFSPEMLSFRDITA